MESKSQPLSHGLAGVPRNAEEARAFLQRRIRLFTGVVWMLSFGFYLLAHVLDELATHGHAGWFLSGDVAHLGATAVPCAIWVLCRVRRWQPGVLAAFDAAGIIATGAGYAWMGSFATSEDGGFPMILAVTHTCFARAVLVPSSASRTLAIHSCGFFPSLVLRYLKINITYPEFALLGASYVALWGIVALVLTTLTSWVIYGLRERVRATMQLGQYTLVEKIGEGGMGVVYRASHAMLRRPTAIKLLPADKAGERSLLRFEREVQLTSRLTHPNTVAIYDFGRTPDGVFYYAMEYLDGVTLEELVLDRGPQPAARVIHLLRQIASALGEAHRTGLIHRDIKPANVIVCERGGLLDVAKVLDFGLVKDISRPEIDAGVTQTNTITGTPLYLAPEAVSAPDRVGPASDLYALGAVGYYLLTGENVFGGKSMVEIIAHHLHTAPEAPSSRLGKPIPEDLEALVMDCLRKDPDERPGSAQAFEAALAECTDAAVWTQEEAARWWPLRKNPVPPKKDPGSVSTASPATVAIDLRTRGAA